MTIADRYAAYCSSLTYDDLPDPVVEFTGTLIRDYVGLTVGGHAHSPTAPAVIKGARSLDTAESGSDGATVLATGERLSPATACLSNGALAHCLDFDDTVFGGHVGAVVISAALAAGEAADTAGEQFVTGVVAGYEVMTRMLEAINRPVHYNRGFHPTATCGVFGATAAAGVVRGLPAATLGNAFGVNASQVAGTNGYTIHGGWNKRLHPGLAAHAAILATEFAAAGFEGIERPIDGERNVFAAYTTNPDEAAATEGLGETFNVLETGIKPFPCGRRNHPAMALAMRLGAEHDLDPDRITSITVSVSEQNVSNLARPRGRKRDPTDLVDAQFSLPFCVALALVNRQADLPTFLSSIRDGIPVDITSVMDRLRVVPTEDIFPSGDPDYHAHLTVETEDDVFQDRLAQPPGDPANPLSEEQLSAKFTSLTNHFDPDERQRLWAVAGHPEMHSVRSMTDIVRSVVETA